jgi:hypothetical protein
VTVSPPSVLIFLASGPQLSNKIKVKFTLQPTVSQSASQPVSLGVKPHLGPGVRYLLLSGSCSFVDGFGPCCIALAWTHKKHCFHHFLYSGTYPLPRERLPSHSLVMTISSGYALLAFSTYVTILQPAKHGFMCLSEEDFIYHCPDCVNSSYHAKYEPKTKNVLIRILSQLGYTIYFRPLAPYFKFLRVHGYPEKAFLSWFPIHCSCSSYSLLHAYSPRMQLLSHPSQTHSSLIFGPFQDPG